MQREVSDCLILLALRRDMESHPPKHALLLYRSQLEWGDLLAANWHEKAPGFSITWGDMRVFQAAFGNDMILTVYVSSDAYIRAAESNNILDAPPILLDSVTYSGKACVMNDLINRGSL